MNEPGSHSHVGSDGFIAVAVLWILAAMAALASIYTIYVVDTAAAVSFHDDRVRIEALTSAALELTAYRLAASLPSGPTAGHFSVRLGQATVTTDFRSEAARIDLNAAPKQLLAGLFVALGIAPDLAANYADRISIWRGSEPNAQEQEVFAYRAAGLGYVPRQGRFPNINELSLVRDVPAGLVQRALPFLTVFSGRPQINILEAAPEVIAALPGMTPDRLNGVLIQRKAAPDNGTALMQLLGPGQAYATTQGSRASRVTVHVAFDNEHRAGAEAVILMFEQGAEPYSVLSWRDDIDEPRPFDQLRASSQ